MKLASAFLAGATAALVVATGVELPAPSQPAPAATGAESHWTETGKITKSQDRHPALAAAAAEMFAPSACVSHVEVTGSDGLEFELVSPAGDVLHADRIAANETIFFKDATLPSVTTRTAPGETASLVMVNAEGKGAPLVASAK